MASAIRQSASGASTSSWSHRAIYSPVAHFNRAVRVAGYARVFRPERDTESAVPRGDCFQRLSRFGGRAAAVVQADLPRAVRLGKQRIRQRAEEFRARVEHGDDDADAHIREGVRALYRQFALGCFLPPESPFVPQQHPCRQHFTRAVQRVPRAMHPHIRPNPFTHCTRVPPADFPALIIPCAAGFVKHRAIFCQFGTIFAKPLDQTPEKVLN